MAAVLFSFITVYQAKTTTFTVAVAVVVAVLFSKTSATKRERFFPCSFDAHGLHARIQNR